jgi:ubiquinone/menaquinone biosynthesis C-methylase UbiE
VEGWRVLDVGCGHGLYSMAFALRRAYLCGCDLALPDLRAAYLTAQGMGLDGWAAFLAADGARLPVSENVFDLVVCNCVLEHIVEDQAALAGMVRALRPGGLLYLTVDNAEHKLVLGFLERLPARIRAWVLRPEVSGGATVAQGLDDYTAALYHVQRRYQGDDLVSRLEALGLEVVARQAYLTTLGAAHHEAFHLLRGLHTQRSWGRVLYMASSLILYPFVVLADGRQRQRGYGLVLAARKAQGDGQSK